MSNVTVQEALKSEDVYIFDINQPFVTQEQKFKYWEESKAEIKRLKAALVEIDKCEPVAWLVYAKGSRRYFTLTFDVDKVPQIYLGGEAIPLFPSPISKEWVGLTYDQKMDLKENNDWYNFPSDLIEATEAKLKQLNAPEKG